MIKLKNYIKKGLKRFSLSIPLVRARIRELDELRKLKIKVGMFEPGHYYSPIPALDEAQSYLENEASNDKLLDLEMYEKDQLVILQEIKQYYSEIPFYKKDNKVYLRYQKEGAYYRYSDLIFLYSMMRYAKSRKIVEIGSGYSSAAILDVNDLFFDGNIQTIFIDPNPERLLKLFSEEDKKNCQVLVQKVQKVDKNIFSSLEKNDILFIDSSHVSKIGSDLNYIFFEILPIIKPGVYIHFHDIFYPFELPKHWVLGQKWFWNENYLLRAFLMNNNNYRIFLFNTFLQKNHREFFEKEMPICLEGEQGTGSIWIRKEK